MKHHYLLEGTPNSPVLVFSNSLGADYTMWDDLVPALLPYFRVLRYDTRGHGKSEVTDDEYSIAQLAHDVIDLADSLGIEKFAFCGLSMGGLIGQHLGIHFGHRLTHLVLSNTAAKIGEDQRWNERINRIATEGTASMASETMHRWFSEAFVREFPDRIQQMQVIFSASPDVGYCACCAAIRDADYRTEVSQITTPALVITGELDPLTTVADARYLTDHISASQLLVVPQTKHLSATESPSFYTENLINFLVGTSSAERGMHIRRTVLGHEHVDKANQKINEFNGDFQEFITKYAWGEIWARPGLSKPNRSLITLSLLIALNRKDEFRMHVKAALNNGLSKKEIKELIMHSALYCGLPAANEAIHTAEEVFNQLGK